MTTTTPESRGQILYTAYGKRVNFLTHDDKPLPMFHELGEKQRDAWIYAANLLWELAKTGKATLT